MGSLLNNQTISLMAQMPQQYLARTFNYQPPMPFNYTLSITNRCNSHCKTCRIYEQKKIDMSPDEWHLIFKGLGHTPYWITLSGGEPFIRKDLEQLIYDMAVICEPAIINIPTNGLCIDTAQRVAEMVSNIQCQLVINVSVDHNDPQRNDFIRGIDGAYGKAINTFMELKKIKAPNLTVGIHTVISRFNVDDFNGICDSMLNLEPDQYITEIAEERNELGTKGLGITPGLFEYTKSIDYLIDCMSNGKKNGLPEITDSFRRQYYENVKRWLEGNDVKLPCYAGRGVAHISSDGEVWACCIKAASMGNLRGHNYSFQNVWYSKMAKRIRRDARKCVCPMANVAYTNLLLNPASIVRVIKHIM